MGRVLCIDYGVRRCGIAVTDPLQLIVQGLAPLETNALLNFLTKYIDEEVVDKIVIGKPGKPSHDFEEGVNRLVADLLKLNPELNVVFANEDFSSQRASEIMQQMGIKKSVRRKKETLDTASAIVILQEYLGFI